MRACLGRASALMKTNNFPKLIIFIGPQGAGKTTHARILSKWFKRLNRDAHVTSLTHYTVFHLGFIRLLGLLCKTNVVKVRFYEDLPPQPFPSTEIYRRLFPLLIFLHFIGFTLSLIKLRLLMFLHEIIIEHEGYIFKQLADLNFLAMFIKLRPDAVAGGLLKRFNMMILNMLLNDEVLIVRLRVGVNVLKKRYINRPHIEPTHYILFQERVYNITIKHLSACGKLRVIAIDSSANIAKVFLNIVTKVFKNRSIFKRRSSMINIH